MPTLLKPSFLQLKQTRLASRVSARVGKPSKVAPNEKSEVQRATKLDRFYANAGSPDGIGY